VKVIVAVSAFNESKVIYRVVKSIPRRIKNTTISIVVVDDGSFDNTAQEARKAKAIVVRHILNRGLGAAIKTGIDYAQRQQYEAMVTFDGDGQHNPADIEKIIAPIFKKEADLVVGSRFTRSQNVPVDRLIINWLANLATLLLFGVSSTDSQSGLRAFSKKALNLIDYKGERMDFSSEILLEAKKHKLIVTEVPIEAIYTKYSRIKGQKNINSINVLLRFLVRIFR